MKKILIFTALILMFGSLDVMAGCKIEEMDTCKANLGNQPQTIKDKLVPNHLNQMVNPTKDASKEFRNMPHSIPETINTDVDSNPEREETNTPYNAACQFGVCIPGENTGSSSNR